MDGLNGLNGATVNGLSPEDLSLRKIGRRQAQRHRLHRAHDCLRNRVADFSCATNRVVCGRGVKEPLDERFTIAVGLTQTRDEHGRAPGLSDPVRRAIGDGMPKQSPSR